MEEIDEIDVMRDMFEHVRVIAGLSENLDDFSYDDLDTVMENWQAIVRLWDRVRYIRKKRKRKADPDYDARCQALEKKNAVNHYARNRERILEKQSQYYRDNKRAILKKREQYYRDNQDAILDKVHEKRWKTS